MKRFVFAAVAGLCSFASAQAQDGYLAPTVPVVPTPVVQDGKLLNSGTYSTWDTRTGPRPFSLMKRSATSTSTNAIVNQPVAPAPTGYGYPMPPLPEGVGGPDGLCGKGGCAHGRDGLNWGKLKAWLCYHPSNTDLPKCRPTPYYTPLQGMFPCTSHGGYGCASSCQSGNGYPLGQPQPTQPQMQPPMPIPQPMPMPSSNAGPVVMPPRGMQGAAIPPTWQGRTAPVPANPGISGFRYATPEATAVTKPTTLPGTVVSTGLKVPQK